MGKGQSQIRPWAVLVGCCLLLGVAFTIPMLNFGVFIAPIVNSFECSVTEVSLYFTFTSFTAVLSSLLGARLLKKSMRTCVIIGSVIMGCAFICLGLFPSVPMVWATGAIAGLCYPLCSSVLAPIAINNWFSVHRGTLIGIAFAMVGVFGMVYSPVFTYFINSYGWERAIMIAGAWLIVVDVLVAIFLLRQHPAQMGMLPYGAQEIADESTAREAAATTPAPTPAPSTKFVGTPAFFLCVLVALAGGFFGDFNSQLNAVAQKSGFDSVTAGFALSCAAAGLMIGKIIMGWLKDRKGSTFAIACGCAIGIGAFACITAGILSANVVLLYAGSFLSGFCTCLGTLTPSLLASEAFAPGVYAQAVSYVTAACNFGMAIGIPCYTLTYDITGSFIPILIVCTVLPVAVALVAAIGIRLGKRTYQAY